VAPLVSFVAVKSLALLENATKRPSALISIDRESPEGLLLDPVPIG
jgi:hypothetical protein